MSASCGGRGTPGPLRPECRRGADAHRAGYLGVCAAIGAPRDAGSPLLRCPQGLNPLCSHVWRAAVRTGQPRMATLVRASAAFVMVVALVGVAVSVDAHPARAS